MVVVEELLALALAEVLTLSVLVNELTVPPSEALASRPPLLVWVPVGFTKPPASVTIFPTLVTTCPTPPVPALRC